jgi:hypothetical protein
VVGTTVLVVEFEEVVLNGTVVLVKNAVVEFATDVVAFTSGVVNSGEAVEFAVVGTVVL